ncbi:hypothetical protein [Methylococcus capsulatus]|uniref:hypothetical protein n=1 Tax=Methylococcus capsulatus TaxID=414 RepID=UPI001C52F6AB|nr:hypothetical protein [Methylococcus capsulatus]QXP88728.1 hypothetical protein KW112_06390 [Methylococcus capsulatus]QXP94240.1 hypothetical protein KW113_03245 [Methylococcus capsulatus]UQN11007.1 hypothetical protein M3M30_08135 [Methylococcus capsulatus]
MFPEKSRGPIACLLSAGFGVIGCTEPSPKPAASEYPAALPTTAAGDDTARPLSAGTGKSAPKPALIRARAFEGTVKAIHPAVRQVVFLLADGKRVTVTVSPRAGSLADLRVGDLVTFELAETVEIVRNDDHHPETGEIVMHPVPGSMQEREYFNPYYHRDGMSAAKRHESHWSGIIEIPSWVVSYDSQSRLITLKSREGRVFSVRVAPEAGKPDEYAPGEAVVARFKEVEDVTVIRPR